MDSLFSGGKSTTQVILVEGQNTFG